MKLELDLNSSQKTTLINQSENDLGAEDIKKMLRSGISFAKEGNRLEARQMLLNVTEADPNNETAWLWLASISEYPEELLVFLQNVLKVNPNNERALEWAKQTKTLLSKTFVQRGINAAQNNQKEFAKQCFLQGIVHDSENEMAWLWLASTSESQEEKVSHLHQVLRINPENETALSSLNAVKGQQSQGLLKKANSAAIAGDHEAARQTLNTVLKNSPELEEAWILKAFLAVDFYEKIECYQKALEINPGCEAAQAGLASLQLLMPKMPKPIEEAKIEETIEEVKAEENIPAEETVFAQDAIEAVIEAAEENTQENVEFDQNFDLEQLAEEVPVEAVEFQAQENEEPAQQEYAETESRAIAEEVHYEKQQLEESIHETQTGLMEDFTETQSQSQAPRIESIFNYDEVIAEEETQAESVLEFDESSDNPTQELDEDFAKSAAAAFNVAEENEVEEIEATLETEAQNVAELEDFYTETETPEAEAAPVSVEESTAPVSLKTEVKITETYITEVETSDVYGSEFYGNDGFVLVPQNDPFADYNKETVEFSYTEENETSDTVEAESAEPTETAESKQAVESAVIIEPAAEALDYKQPEEVEEVSENSPSAEAGQEVVENQVSEQYEENSEEALAEEQQEVVESQYAEFAEEEVAAYPTEEVQEAAENHFVEEVEEVELAAEVSQFAPAEEVGETEFAGQTEVAEEVSETQETEETVEAQSFTAIEESVEAQSFATDEEAVETQSFAADEETEQAAFEAENADQSSEEYEPVQTNYFEQTEEQPAQEVFENQQPESNGYFAQAEPEAQTFVAPQVQLNQCPFCAAENDPQSVVCNACQAMLSLSDLEALISHQGVNQDLLLHAVEKMEVEKSLREFNAEELTFLAIAHLNAKNLEKGLGYLKDASALNPTDIVLPSKIKFLTAHLEELKANKTIIGKNRTILVVDDSPTVRKLISGKLEKCGHSVLAAVDGMDALAKINEVIPDLILLDITMPRLDGYQVCKLIRNNEMTKDVPIVMISGKDGFFDKVRGRMAGSTGYITKPFGPDTLMKTIETYLS